MTPDLATLDPTGSGLTDTQQFDEIVALGSDPTKGGPIPNAEAGTIVTSVVLSDPNIKFVTEKVAKQMNDQSTNAVDSITNAATTSADPPPSFRPVFRDLGDRIADIVIETSAQGASILEVHIIDPQLWLLRSNFITVDEDGVLYPPIEVTFPPDAPGAVYRLAEVRFQTVSGTTEANLILTFEDKVVALMRETDAQIGGVKQSTPGQKLADFLSSLVFATSKVWGTTIGAQTLIDPQDPNFNAPTTQKPSLPGLPKTPADNKAAKDAAAAAAAAHQRKLDAANRAIVDFLLANGDSALLAELEATNTLSVLFGGTSPNF